MTRLLASVRDGAEATDALAAGADIVDFKDPAHGALGALPPEEIGRGMAIVAGRALTSATAGDWPLEPRALVEAARRIGATGVDYVKLGLLPGAALTVCIHELRSVAREHRLVAVFFADRGVPLAALEPLRTAGFAGAMIDTAEKAGGGLRRHLDDAALARFVDLARAAGLMTGLAGSLRPGRHPSAGAHRAGSARFPRRTLRRRQKLGPLRRADTRRSPSAGPCVGPRGLMSRRMAVFRGPPRHGARPGEP